MAQLCRKRSFECRHSGSAQSELRAIFERVFEAFRVRSKIEPNQLRLGRESARVSEASTSALIGNGAVSFKNVDDHEILIASKGLN